MWYARDTESLNTISFTDKKKLVTKVPPNTGRLRHYQPSQKRVFELTRLATSDQLTSQGASETSDQAFEFGGRVWKPPAGLHWKTTTSGLSRLAAQGRIIIEGNSLRYVRFLDDFPVFPISNIWSDVGGIQSRTEGKLYVVQTAALAIQRCLLMTTDPRRPRARSHLRFRHNRIRRRTVGTPLDYNRHEPRTACPFTPATLDGDLSVLRTQRRITRTGGRVCLQAQAEQQRRRGWRHRSTRHSEINRQQRTTRRRSPCRPARSHERHHPCIGSVLL